MPDNTDLFNPTTVPYQEHSAASRRAAKGYQVNAGTDREKVLKYLQRQGKQGATDNEMIRHFTEMSPNTPRARRVRLWRDGQVSMTERERDGSTVWVFHTYATKHDDQLNTKTLFEKYGSV